MTQSTTHSQSQTSPIVIAPPALGDILPLRRLFRKALRDDFQYFPPSYTDRISQQNSWWRLLLARYKPERVMVLAKARGRIIGYAIGSLTPQGNGELYWLYVDPTQRSRNVGSALLDGVRDEMRRRGAKVVTLVTYDLKDYYLHLGFHYRGKQHIHGLDLDVMEYPVGEHGKV